MLAVTFYISSLNGDAVISIGTVNAAVNVRSQLATDHFIIKTSLLSDTPIISVQIPSSALPLIALPFHVPLSPPSLPEHC